MTITTKRELSGDLPAAHIFLEDIEEISNEFRELSKKTAAEVKYSSDGPVTYELNDEETCDTIEDLRGIGGKTREFRINSPVARLWFRKYGTSVHISGRVPEDQRWALHARLAAILERRSLRLRNAWEEIPPFVRGFSSALLFLVLPWSGWILALNKYAGFMAIAVSLFVARKGWLLEEQHGVVEFRSFRDRQRLPVSTRDAILVSVATIVGTIIGSILTYYLPKLLDRR